jgi:hypothetical protein
MSNNPLMLYVLLSSKFEPRHDKTNVHCNAFASSMDPDQPAHPRSYIRVNISSILLSRIK